MGRVPSELFWFAACCLLLGFFGLCLLGVDLKATYGWPLVQLLPIVIVGAGAVAGAVALMVAAYRRERK